MSTSWWKPALLGVTADVPARVDAAVDASLEAFVAGEADPALRFSRIVGAMSACRRAAVLVSPSSAVLPAPAPADAQRLRHDHPWRGAVQACLAESNVRLVHEACGALVQRRHSLPWAVLPMALDLGRRHTALRDMLWPVWGERGHWLAHQREEWRYAAAMPTAVDDQALWQDGSIEQRLVYFRALRARDPSHARSLFQQQLGEWRAKERAAFVEALAIGLSPDDEALLDPLLKDRGGDVRQLVGPLLARLPSAHARRLHGWMEPWLTSKRGLFARGWTCEAPTAADDQWSSAGIEAKRPQHHALGERAWWLYQFVRQLPLRWWTERTGMNPAELLAWAEKTDWAAALQLGWRERIDGSERAWLDAMLASSAPEMLQHRAELLALLTPRDREGHWPRSLDAWRRDGIFPQVTGAVPPGEWLSPSYSQALLPSLRELFANDALRNDMALRSWLLELAPLLHPQSLQGWQALPRRDDETAAMAEVVHTFERIVAMRRALHENL